MWIVTSILSAVFAGVTSILIKCGVKHTDSDVATALRTCVVLVFSWIMVFIVGSAGTIVSIEWKEALFLCLSGACTGISWISYSRALYLGDVNKVAPIDKSSSVLTVIFAIVIFNETNNLWVKIISVAAIFVGTMLMIPKKEVGNNEKASKSWAFYAILSAVFAALTSIFAKIGIKNVESNLGTAIRTCVVLVISWIIVFAKKKAPLIKTVDKKELLFILLSGVTTGASWLCYYSAIQNGIVSVVVPIDKLSIVITIVFSMIFLKEKLSVKAWIGLSLIVAGTIVMAVFA